MQHTVPNHDRAGPQAILGKGRFRWLRQDFVLYALLLPGIFYYLIFQYGPMYGVLIAFQKYNIFDGFWASPWVGLDNFKQLLSSRDFYQVFMNTLSLNAYSLIFGFPVPILLAILLNEAKNKLFVTVTQSMLYLPHFFSWVVIGGILIGILSPKYGVVNQILSGLGMEPIYFLGDKAWWVVTYVLSGIWKEAGWSAIIYYAALQSIDTTLYEAARIDGANRFKQLLYVTLPGIRTTIAIMLILKISALLTIGFEQPFILSNPLVLERADVISTFIFTMGIQQGQFSLTAAMGLFQSVIGLTLVLIANAFIKKMGEEGIF